MYRSNKTGVVAATPTNVLRATMIRFQPKKMIGAATILATGFGLMRLADRVGRLVLNVVRDHFDLVIIGVDAEPAFAVTCLQQESLTSMEQSRPKPDIAPHQTRA